MSGLGNGVIWTSTNGDHKKYAGAGMNFNVGGQKEDACGEIEKEKVNRKTRR